MRPVDVREGRPERDAEEPDAAEDAAERQPGEHLAPHRPATSRASPTSPSASARMTSVDACEPELPPLEMMSGTNSASTTAFEISCSKTPIAVAVSISPRNSAVSQPARLRIMRAERDVHVRLVEGLRSADALDVPGRLRLGHVEHVVDGDDADQHAGGVGDGQRGAVVLPERGDRRGLVVGRLERDEPPVHQVGDAAGRAASAAARGCGCRR